MSKSSVKRPTNRELEGKELQLFEKLEKIAASYTSEQFEDGIKESKAMKAEIDAAKKEGVDVKDIKRELTKLSNFF